MIVIDIISYVSLFMMMTSFIGIIWKYKNIETKARKVFAIIMTVFSGALFVCSIIKLLTTLLNGL